MTRRRVAFILYALAWHTATHWPNLAVGPPGFRFDLLYHAGAFGLWCILCAVAAWFGPVLSVRNVAGSTVVAMLVGVADELSQILPAFGRTFDVLDVSANLAGALAGGIVLGMTSVWTSRARP